MAKDQSATVTAGRGNRALQDHFSPRLGWDVSEVYVAEDINLRRRVALKFPPEHLTEDEGHLRRFEQEARHQHFLHPTSA